MTRNLYLRQNGQWVKVNNIFIYGDETWTRVETLNLRTGGTTWSEAYRWRFIHSVTISAFSEQELDVRARAIAAGWDGIIPLTATVTVTGTGWLQAPSVSTYALKIVGPFPTNSSITVNVQSGGTICGRGGRGGNGGRGHNYNCVFGITDSYTYNNAVQVATAGEKGGSAIYIKDMTVSINNAGTISGGGGGGAGGWALSNQRSDRPVWWSGSTNGGGGGGGGRPFGLAGTGGAVTQGFLNGGSVGGVSGSNGTAGTQSTAGTGGTATTSADLPRYEDPNDPQAITGYDSGFWMVGAGGNGGGLGQAGVSRTYEKWTFYTNPYKDNSYQGYSETVAGGKAGHYVLGNNWVNWVANGTRLGTPANT